MNKINPFMQPGSLQEQKERKRARFKVAVYSVFGLTILLMSFFLIQGCKRESPTDTSAVTNTPTQDTNTPDTNASLPTPAPTNYTAPVVNAPPPTPPPAPVVPPPVEPSSAKEYVVAKGDSYYSIGKKFGVKIKEIAAANPGVEPSKLKVGQKLQIPGPSSSSSSSAAPADAGGDTYKVKSGDTLGKIAKQNGVTIKALEEANDLKTSRIKVGQSLKMPAKTATPEAAASVPAAVPPPASPTPAPTNTGMPSSPTAR